MEYKRKIPIQSNKYIKIGDDIKIQISDNGYYLTLTAPEKEKIKVGFYDVIKTKVYY